MSFFNVPKTPKMYTLDTFERIHRDSGKNESKDWTVVKEENGWSVRHCDVIVQVFETKASADAYKRSMSEI